MGYRNYGVPKPRDIETPKPRGTGTSGYRELRVPKPRGTGTPKPRATETSGYRNFGLPKFRGSGTPKPRGTETSGYRNPQTLGYQNFGVPKPRGSGTPKPRVTGTPPLSHLLPRVPSPPPLPSRGAAPSGSPGRARGGRAVPGGGSSPVPSPPRRSLRGAAAVAAPRCLLRSPCPATGSCSAGLSAAWWRPLGAVRIAVGSWLAVPGRRTRTWAGRRCCCAGSARWAGPRCAAPAPAASFGSVRGAGCGWG